MAKSLDLTEYNKLKAMLVFYEIPFEECVRLEEDLKMIRLDAEYRWDQYQLFYPSASERLSDVIISPASYGHEKGLLEQMGLIEKHDESDVEGYLDAITVFKRWAENYGYFVKGLDL